MVMKLKDSLIMIQVATFCFLLVLDVVSAFTEENLRGAASSRFSNQRFLQDETKDVILTILQFGSIPIFAAIVGMATNWLALKMTFYPTFFFGCEVCGKYSRCKDQPVGCIGWQGIVPTKAGKMAAQSVELMTTKVFDMKEIFARIEKEKAALHIKEGFEKSLSEIIDRIINEFVLSKDKNWERAESAIRSQLTKWALDELPTFSEGFMGELVERLDDVYDLTDMCVTEMTANPQILNDIFESVGQKELIFIRNSGAYFGFPLGLIQMTVFIFFNFGFLLPVFGFIVGIITNLIALKMIFEPIEPKVFNICGKEIIIQGLFLKRQKQASIAFARKIVGTVLHSENIWKHMLNGPKSDEFKKLLDKHVGNFTDNMIGYARPLVKMYLGEDEFNKMREIVREMSQAQIEDIIEFMHEYTDEALDLENEIAVKMGELSSKEFERVLHPVFEEDEAKLIAVGGVLGLIVGLFQMFVINGDTDIFPS